MPYRTSKTRRTMAVLDALADAIEQRMFEVLVPAAAVVQGMTLDPEIVSGWLEGMNDAEETYKITHGLDTRLHLPASVVLAARTRGAAGDGMLGGAPLSPGSPLG